MAEPRIVVPRQPRPAWYARLILALQRRKYGRELEPARLWSRMPRAFLMLTLLYRALDRAAALERFVAPEKLAALREFESSPLYAERERAALAYAEGITDPARGVGDELFARLRAQYTEQQILELTALIAFQNLSSKFNAALAVPAQSFCAPRPVARVGNKEISLKAEDV